MRGALILITILVPLLYSSTASAWTSVWCGFSPNNKFQCFNGVDPNDPNEADRNAEKPCLSLQECGRHPQSPFRNSCVAIGVVKNSRQVISSLSSSTIPLDSLRALDAGCKKVSGNSCVSIHIACDPLEFADTQTPATSDPTPFETATHFELPTINLVAQGIFLGIGVVFVLILYAARARIINFVIHGNLPYKLP
ncbi:MAG: hypothetical protein WAM75_12370, partial [Xanthobacteraceae bacterium]